MFSKTRTTKSTTGSCPADRLRQALADCDAVIVGTGAGLSAAAGFTYDGERYESFLRTRRGQKLLFLELGVGYNTPVIIKYPFWRMTAANPRAVYACLNLGQAAAPRKIQKQSICIDGDIGAVLAGLGENTSQSASVEFVRFRRTNSARG